MKRTLIHNATIVNEGQSVKGSVVIEDGRIAEVLTNWKPDRKSTRLNSSHPK